MAVLWDVRVGVGVSDQAFVFETYSKNCSGLQSVLIGLSAGGRGLVAGDGFQAFPH